MNPEFTATPSAASSRGNSVSKSIDYVELTLILICFFEDNVKGI